MDYGQIKKTAVPHVTTLGVRFQIDYLRYQNSLIIECSFIVLIIPLLAIWVYFSSKYKKAKKKVQKQEPPIQNMKHEHNQHPVEDSQMHEQGNEFHIQIADKQNSEKIKIMLQLVQRRIYYGICFFALHIVAVNSLDAGIISIATFYCSVLFYGVFNVYRPKKSIFLMCLYILPAIGSAFAIWFGQGQLGTHLP